MSDDSARAESTDLEGAGQPNEAGFFSNLRPRLASRDVLANLVTYWTVAALALLLIVFAFVIDNFYTEANFEATSLYATGVLTLALGQSFAIFSGGIDLSVGGVLAFSSMAAALTMRGLVNDGYEVH